MKEAEIESMQKSHMIQPKKGKLIKLKNKKSQSNVSKPVKEDLSSLNLVLQPASHNIRNENSLLFKFEQGK